jgi:2-C-methyl-D-erythritol 4-phosphate cytidylyltransferase
MKRIALILAGGKGSRMHNNSIPKQFVEIDGKPVIIHTMEVFCKHSQVDAIIVACLEEWIPFLKESILRYGISKVVDIVPGGDTGQDSIYNALCAAREYVSGEEAIVLVHDAVRPLVDPKTINDNIDIAEKHGNCITCAHVMETPIVRNSDGTMNFPNRSDVIVARAPQTFRLNELFGVHEQALVDGKHDFLDSCTLMAYYGYELTTVIDFEENIKITTSTDLILAETIYRIRKEKLHHNG